MILTGWQLLGFLYYAASAVAVFAITMVYQVVRTDLDNKLGNKPQAQPVSRGAAMASTISGLLWPVMLPIFGIAAACVIIKNNGRIRRGASRG